MNAVPPTQVAQSIVGVPTLLRHRIRKRMGAVTSTADIVADFTVEDAVKRCASRPVAMS
jgi:hypothetical protein